MKLHAILFCMVFCSVFHAAVVLKVSNNKKAMAISHDVGKKWKQGQGVCVQGVKREKICGQVMIVKQAAAICKMNASLEGIVPGHKVLPSNNLNSDESQKEKSIEEQNSSPRTNRREGGNITRRFGLGIKGGLNLANISTADPNYEEASHRTVLDAGLFLDFPLGNGSLSFEPGINFVQKGYETSVNALGLNYIDLRLLMKVRVISGNFTPVFYLGPYVALLLSAESSDVDGTADVKSSYKTLDFGAIGGIGFEFKLSEKVDIGVSGFYNLGLRAIEENLFNIEDPYPMKNKGIHLLAQFTLQF